MTRDILQTDTFTTVKTASKKWTEILEERIRLCGKTDLR